METTVAAEKKRSPKRRTAKASGTKKVRSRKSDANSKPSLTALFRSLLEDRSKVEKVSVVFGAVGLASIAASRRGRLLLGRASSFAFPIAISILQPRVEAFVRSAIEKKLNRTDA